MTTVEVAVPGRALAIGAHPDDLHHPPDDPRDALGHDELGPDQPVNSR